MLFEKISIEAIDAGDERYRISEALVSPALESSLREIGQMNPLTLVEGKGGSLVVVTGFRRVNALKGIGATHALARILPRENSGPLEAFRLAVWDNVAHRELQALEKARALHTLKHTCGASRELLVGTYLPLLGLEPHKNVLQVYLALHNMTPALKHLLMDSRITPAVAERLAGKSPEDQQQIGAAFEKARWSTSLQRQLLDLVEELAVTGKAGFGGVFNRPEIAALLDDVSLSPFQRGEQVYAALYRWRNPRLSRAEEKFRQGKRSLGLPGAVRLTPEPFFETPRLRVEFEAPSPEQFRELAAAVQRAAESPRLAELFEVR